MPRVTVTDLQAQIAQKDREIETLRQQLEAARVKEAERIAALRLIGTLVEDATKG